MPEQATLDTPYHKTAERVFQRCAPTVPPSVQLGIERGAWFFVERDEWEERDGNYYRTIHEAELLEVVANGGT